MAVLESFTHPDGPLEGQVPEIGGTWTPHSGDGTNDIQVASGQAILNQPDSGEDIHSDFSSGPMEAGDVMYAAFDLTVPAIDPGAAITSGYFAHFKTSGNFFGARISIAPPTASGYTLAISGDGNIGDADGEAFWGSDLAFGTTYRIVSSYVFDTGETKMWVNPTLETDTSITATDVFAEDAFENYSFRQSGINSTQMIDNLCVASTFTEAVTCIPEPATMSLLSLAGLAFAGLMRRRS